MIFTLSTPYTSCTPALQTSAEMCAQINYINAHATSTLVGDIAEVKAIKQVFPTFEKIKVNGTKSMVGHSLGAAAGIEAIVTIQAIRSGWLHPTLNQVRPWQTLSTDRFASLLVQLPCCRLCGSVSSVSRLIISRQESPHPATKMT